LPSGEGGEGGRDQKKGGASIIVPGRSREDRAHSEMILKKIVLGEGERKRIPDLVAHT